MTVISANDLALLRQEYHRSAVYLSMLEPLDLWTARVNDAGIEAGETAIVFDGGSGSHFAAIEAPQTLWVGSDAGANDVGIIRIRSISSGDGGVTGTVTVAAQNFAWANDLYLTFKHNYELWAKYPWIDPATEIFYKDRDTAYPGADRPPVPLLSLSMKAGFIRNGSLTFFVNGSFSYPVQAGTAVSSYALSCYPTSGVTVDFNTTTGIGSVKVTSLTQAYYWLKLTVMDDNGQSISTWRCVFAHNPDPNSATHPIKNFRVNQVVRSIGRSGTFSQVIVDDTDLSGIPKRAFTVLWKESSYGEDMMLGNHSRMVAAGDKIYVNPSIGYSIDSSSIPFCNADFTFTAGVLLDGSPAPDGTTCNLEFAASGMAGTVMNSANTAGGIVTITLPTSGSVDCSGSVTYTDSDAAVNLLTAPYSYLSSPAAAADQPYPSTLWVFPKHLAVGYLYRARAQADIGSRGVNNTTMDIVSVEEYMRREFQFSVTLTSDDSPSHWFEFPADELSVGEALWHLYYWHSTLPNIVDMAGLDSDGMDLNYATDFEEGTLFGMAETMYGRVRRTLSTDRNGNMRFVPIINLLTDAERAALDTTMTIVDADKGANISFVQRHHKPAAMATVSGIYFPGTFDSNGNPEAEGYCAVAPGDLPEYGGEAIVRLERQTLRDQAHANALAGRLLARENREIEEIVVLFHGDYSDFLDPKADLWAITDANNDLGISWSGQGLIPDTVTIQVSSEGAITCFGFFEPEVTSRDGISTDCLSFPEDPGGEIIIIPDTPGDGFGKLYTMTEDVLARTLNLSASYPLYSSIGPAGAGEFYDFILDPWNPRQRGWLSTEQGLYLSTDLDQTVPSWTAMLSKATIEAALGTDFLRPYKVLGSINVEGYVAYFFTINTAMYCAFSNDYGATWNYATSWHSGTVAWRGAVDIVPHVVNGNLTLYQWIQGPGSDNTLKLYKSTNRGQSWAAVYTLDIGTNDAVYCTTVHCPYDDNDAGDIVYLGHGDAGAGVSARKGVYRSTNGGSAISELVDESILVKRWGVETYTEDRTRVYYWNEDDELWLSTNDAASFSQKAAAGISGNIMSTGGFPTNENQFYVMTDGVGIYVSITEGDSFIDKTGDWNTHGWGTPSVDGRQVIVPLWVEE